MIPGIPERQPMEIVSYFYKLKIIFLSLILLLIFKFSTEIIKYVLFYDSGNS